MSKAGHGGSRPRHRQAPSQRTRVVLTPAQAQQRIEKVESNQPHPSVAQKVRNWFRSLFRWRRPKDHEDHPSREPKDRLTARQYAAKLDSRRRRREARAARQHARRKNGKW